MNDIKRSKHYWEAVGKSACPDDIMRDMSISEISKYLREDEKLLDLGCGNGYCTYEFSKSNPRSILGLDYSQTSIEAANNALKENKSSNANLMTFDVGDALDLTDYKGWFDTIITIRCLINVGDHDKIGLALEQISNSLRPGGRYLMCENFISGLNNINHSRVSVGLDQIKTRWHNTYINDEWFYSKISDLFTIVETNHFLSSYFYVSRVVNAWQAHQNKIDPQYDDPLNYMAAKLPPFGQHSPMRLVILRKK